MPRGIGRFDRRHSRQSKPTYPGDQGPIKDDEAVTGEIPVPADADVSGKIPPIPDIEPTRRRARRDLDDIAGDAESPEPEAEPPPALTDWRRCASRPPGSARYLWHRLVDLTAVQLAWLVRETRIRVPQAGRWLRPRLTRLSATVVGGLLLCASYPRFNWWWAAILAFAVRWPGC